MSTQTRRTSASRRHYSPNASVRIGDSALTLPVVMAICFITGLNLMGTLAFAYIALRAEERADVLQLEVESFKNVLHQNGLPTAAHLPGESP